MLTENDLSPENIAVWGPPSSGKTWLIQAFSQELKRYTELDKDFDYILVDEDTKKVIQPEPPKQEPSRDFSDYLRRFIRKPKPGKSGPKYQVSTQQHLINIRDLPGGWSIGASEDPDSYEEVLQSYLNCKYVIAVFDPTYGNTDGNSSETAYYSEKSTSYAEMSGFSRDIYANLFENFIERMCEDERGASQRVIAIVLTKMDKLTIRRLPREVLESKFGPTIKRLLERYYYKPGVSNSQTPITINAFSTSAAGYYGSRVPNVDDDGNIKKEDRWEPYNAAAPFFWIFELIERERVAKIPKPPFGNNPLEVLAPYPRLRSL